MTRTILITGATDGIGLETATLLAGQGHRLLLHGRNAAKLADTAQRLEQLPGAGPVETFRADLGRLAEVEALVEAVAAQHARLDVLINNAGVFKLAASQSDGRPDVRFLVNTLAPYVLSRRLLPLLSDEGRIVNLSSAAQAPVNFEALAGEVTLDDNQAYAQSKLALTMWSMHLARVLGERGPAIIAVNPASFLGSKMVREAYGIDGGDLRVGADILVRAALSDEFADAGGRYFDNDRGQFAAPHPDALDRQKTQRLVEALDALSADLDT